MFPQLMSRDRRAAMLPNIDICRRHIAAWQARASVSGQDSFAQFWHWKRSVEARGHSILDNDHVDTAAECLWAYLGSFGMKRTGVARPDEIKGLLENVRQSYQGIRDIVLGDGKITHIRNEIQAIYNGLDGITNRIQLPNRRVSSITGKSKVLLAIWGQTPGFDRLTRRRFVKWTHLPDNLPLPHLSAGNQWYEPHEFCDMIEEVDGWIVEWPRSNGGASFSELLAGTPMGRIIDMIYSWKMPDHGVDP